VATALVTSLDSHRPNTVFHPRLPASGSGAPLVWAVDTRHAPMLWFPRDCPRGCIWEGSVTSTEDRERFFGQSAANQVRAIEVNSNYLELVQSCHLIAYRLPTEPFSASRGGRLLGHERGRGRSVLPVDAKLAPRYLVWHVIPLQEAFHS
jgi:hypothetical protein